MAKTNALKNQHKPEPEKATTPGDMRLSGLRDETGRRWVEVVRGADRAILLLDDILAQSGVVYSMLSRANIVLVTDKARRLFKERVQQIQTWKRVAIADKRGWFGWYSVLSSTFLVGVPPFAKPRVVLKNDRKWEARGTLTEWQRTAALLEGQRLLIFCAAFAFVPPLLPLLTGFDNIGVELIGENSKGKTTACKWASSVWGGDPGNKDSFMESWLTTTNGLEPLMRTHAGCLLVLEEANIADAGATTRTAQKQLFEVVFRLAHGVEKARYGDTVRRDTVQLGWLSSGNTPIMKRLMGIEPGEAAAVGVRLFTIPAQVTADLGVFDKLPAGFANSGELVQHLNKASVECYGTPIRAFLERLVREAYWKRARFVQVANSYINRFVAATGVDRNNGSALRVARAFGLIYAAGQLAKDWEVFPANWNIGWAVMKCYRSHLAASQTQGRVPATALDRILTYARQHRLELVDLRAGKVDMDASMFSRSYGF